jgi:hypothetical protein
MGYRGLLRKSFTFLYVDDVRTSQGTYLWATAVCYGKALLFYMLMMFVPHSKQAYGPPRSVTRIALSFHVQKIIVPHRKHMPPQRLVTGMGLLCYM